MRANSNKHIFLGTPFEKAEIPATALVDSIPAGTIPAVISISEPPKVATAVPLSDAIPVSGISVVSGEEFPFPVHSKPQENEVEKWGQQDLTTFGFPKNSFRTMD